MTEKEAEKERGFGTCSLLEWTAVMILMGLMAASRDLDWTPPENQATDTDYERAWQRAHAEGGRRPDELVRQSYRLADMMLKEGEAMRRAGRQIME